MKLYIAAGAHIQRKSTVKNRADEITSKLGGEVDAVFSEGWGEIEVSKRDRFWNWLATPFMFLMMSIYSKSLSKIFSGRTDAAIAEELIDRHETSDGEIYVDKHPHLIVENSRRRWAELHWYQTGFYFVLAGFLTEGLLEISLTELVGIVVYISLAVGALFLPLYIHSTMMERNMHMLKQVDKYREANGIESACLIVGRRHESGTKELCAMFDEIELVE